MKLSESLYEIAKNNTYIDSKWLNAYARHISKLEARVAELEAGNKKLKDNAITEVRNTFESDAIDAWKKRTKELEAQIPQWKSAKDTGFPPIRLQVLISDGKSIAHARRVNAYDNHFEICASNDRVNASDVKFWMPLPKAPEVSDEIIRKNKS